MNINGQNNKQESLSLEAQGKLETLKMHLASLHSLLLQRSGFLAITASLSLALLVVFSFDRTLVPLSNSELRILMIVLLISVPISLLTYVLETHYAIDRTVILVEKIYGGKIDEKSNLKEVTDSIITNIPLFMAVLISLTISYIVYIIWFSPLTI